jgi:hypothetical protein
MVAVQDRLRRQRESKQKILPPFELDETLCLYCPQDNVDSLEHPRVSHWLEFVTQRYAPKLPEAAVRILLLMPCTKTKPYPFSTEHKRINQRLLEAGFRPAGRNPLPKQLLDQLEPEFSPEVLDLSPLVDGRNVLIHRAVISEPLALVPYEHITDYEGRRSPATAYDDPGLFEKRGNAVSPWRADFTATQISDTRWKWGDAEKRAYVRMHNAMAEYLAKALLRTAGHYQHRIAWVAPGLTHRSFVVARDERAAHNVPASRKVGGEALELIGANDLLPKEIKIACLPTLEDCQDALARLAKRLREPKSRIGGIYSRGGGDATPLALPELLDRLTAAIKRAAKQKESVPVRRSA